MSTLADVLNLLPLAVVSPLTAQQRNVMTIPAFPPASVRGDILQHLDAGPPGGEGPPQRVVAVLGPGTTFEGIAQTLMPLYANVATAASPAPSQDELARAIAAYASGYLHADDWQFHEVGVYLPLPVEIDAGTGQWIVNADSIRALAQKFQDRWTARLRTAPAALAIPDALALETQAAGLTVTVTPLAALASQLWTQAQRNPAKTVLLFLATMRALDGKGAVAGAPNTAAKLAIAALAGVRPAQLTLLAATSAGNALLRRFSALLTPLLSATPPDIAFADVETATVMLGNALHQIVPLDVPETAGQQASRPGTAKPVPGAAADPAGGLHRLVLGYDVAVGRASSLLVKGVRYSGPEFTGQLATEPYLDADASHLNAGMDPRMPALLTLLANGTQLVKNTPNGLFDGVRARDDSLMTVGLGHWRATVSTELPALLFAFKSAAPDEFDVFFGLHGLDVQAGPAGGPPFQLLVTGSVPDAPTLLAFFGGTTGADGTVTFSTDWAARFRLAALASPGYRRAQVAQATAQLASSVSQVALVAAAVSPFPAEYQLPFDKTSSDALLAKLKPKMDAAIVAAAGSQSASTLAAAVVDITGNPAAPAYAGYFDDQTFYAGSLVKIAPMYAAFELRSRVQMLVTAAKPAGAVSQQWWQNLLHTIGDVWGPLISRPFPEFPRLNYQQLPNLDAMFTIAPDGTVSFRIGKPPPGKTMDDIIGQVQDKLVLDPAMRFHDWMKSMILWSNNAAASRVINTIGYPYLNSLLRTAGFFHPAIGPAHGPDPRPELGLWISGNYLTQGWKPKADLMPLTPRGVAHYKATTNFTATCQDTARLLTLAAQGKLFNASAAACDEMIALMVKNVAGDPNPPVILGGPGDSTFIGDAVGLRHGDTASSKIGLGDPPAPPNPPVPPNELGMHDCAIIGRTLPSGTDVRYVAVVLGAYNGGGTNTLAFTHAAQACDDSISQTHP